MMDAGMLILVFLAGAALGAFYFLNLWRTVRRLLDAPHPAALAFTNLVLRMAVVLAGFYLLMAGRWERMAAALLGFMLMRQVLVRRLGPKARTS